MGNILLRCNTGVYEDFMYIFSSAKFKDETIVRFLAYSSNSMFEADLPLGPWWDNYTMQLWIKVYDIYGAFVERHISNETVTYIMCIMFSTPLCLSCH